MKIGRARSKRAQGKVNFVNLKMYITLLFKQTIGCTKHEKLDQWTDLKAWGYFLMQNKSQQITSIEEILKLRKGWKPNQRKSNADHDVKNDYESGNCDLMFKFKGYSYECTKQLN